MKFKLQSTPDGIIICRIKEPLTKAECTQVTQGIEKIIASGRAKIILEFSLNAAVGATYFEKNLRILKAAAVKAGGDIKYVVPDPIGQRIFGSITHLDTAVKSLIESKNTPSTSEPVRREQRMEKSEIDAKLLELARLTKENRLLTEKVRELLQIVRQPSTDIELKEAVEHYRKLAAEVEAAPQNAYIKKR